jgi:prevent-host-death family protein
VKDISATDAARNFSDMLDAVEHGHESFRLTRGGRAVARLVPAEAASGRSAKDLLLRHRLDEAWAEDLVQVRSLLVTEERDWNG